MTLTRRLTPYLFLAPALVLLGVFVVYPIIAVVGYSFTDFDIVTPPVPVASPVQADENDDAILSEVEVALSGRGVDELRPLDASAPMVVEAQWDRPNIVARDSVSAYLAANYRGETVMASMGSLGHYMQDLSRRGFGLRDFLHEGNGDIWLNALENPRPFAGWLLIEEQAEGGDMLAKRARENPAFLAGFSRVAEAAGVALYRRAPLTAGDDARR